MLKIDSETLTFTKTRFPAGESCIRVEGVMPHSRNAVINMFYQGDQDLWDLALLTDALRRYGVKEIGLLMFYVPYARQDRVCNKGESLSIKVVADFINSLNFVSVGMVDPHSDVSVALFNNVKVYPQEFSAGFMKDHVGNAIIVSPDAGANKKALKFAQIGTFTDVVRADKVRDVATGNIVETKVYSEHVGDRDFLIVDDICDGGRTFIELAKQLRKLTAGKIMLYVTHGIFSAGTKVFDGIIDQVYTLNPVGNTGNEAVESGNVTRI